MKKLLSLILAVITIFGSSAFAAIQPVQQYSVIIDGKYADCSDLPYAAYQNGNSIMVPLRKICEELGYDVSWDDKTGEITIDDDYIQQAALIPGSCDVTFTGKLKIINMSRRIKSSSPAEIHNGCTYVSADFFREFFNDVVTDTDSISIAPIRCELQQDSLQ